MKFVNEQICTNAHFYLNNLYIDSPLKELQRKQIQFHFQLYGSGTDALLKLYKQFQIHLKLSIPSVVEHENFGTSTSMKEVNSSELKTIKMESSQNETKNINSLDMNQEEFMSQNGIDLEISLQCLNYILTESIPKCIYSCTTNMKPTLIQNMENFDKYPQRIIHVESKLKSVQNPYHNRNGFNSNHVNIFNENLNHENSKRENSDHEQNTQASNHLDNYSNLFLDSGILISEQPVVQISHQQYNNIWIPLFRMSNSTVNNENQLTSQNNIELSKFSSEFIWKGNLILVMGNITIYSNWKDETHFTKSLDFKFQSKKEEKFNGYISQLNSLNINTIIVNGEVDKVFTELCLRNKILLLDGISSQEITQIASYFSIVPIYSLDDLNPSQKNINDLVNGKFAILYILSISNKVKQFNSRKHLPPIYLRLEKDISNSSKFDIKSTSLNSTTVLIIAPLKHQRDILEQKFETKFRMWSSVIKENKLCWNTKDQTIQIVPSHGFPWIIILNDLKILCQRYENILSSSFISEKEKIAISRKVNIIEMFYLSFQGLLFEEMQERGYNLKESILILDILIKSLEHIQIKNSYQEYDPNSQNTIFTDSSFHQNNITTNISTSSYILSPWRTRKTFNTFSSESISNFTNQISDSNSNEKQLWIPFSDCNSFHSIAGIKSIISLAFELFSLEYQSHHIILHK